MTPRYPLPSFRLLPWLLCCAVLLLTGCVTPWRALTGDVAPEPGRAATTTAVEIPPRPDSPELPPLVITRPARQEATVPPELSPVPEATARALTRRLNPRAQGFHSWRELGPALRESIIYLNQVIADPAERALKPWPVAPETLRESALALRGLLGRLDAEPDLLSKRFSWHELAPGALMTGYHTPSLAASLSPDPAYPYPVHGLPTDLVVKSVETADGPRRVFRRVTDTGEAPYFSRGEILAGAVNGTAPVIAWARDPLDLFFLHVEGGGVLTLPDGGERTLVYAAKNGRPFTGLGAMAQREGWLGDKPLTRANLRAYLEARPERLDEILNRNESYVFFALAPEEGASPTAQGNSQGSCRGAMGRPLTSRVSVAVDPRLLPLGGVLALDAEFPEDSARYAQARRACLGLAQDTGGVIQGRRLDYFWGRGAGLARQAMRTRSEAKVYLLLAKEQGSASGSDLGPPSIQTTQRGADHPPVHAN